LLSVRRRFFLQSRPRLWPGNRGRGQHLFLFR
jgi:hypothetical protein